MESFFNNCIHEIIPFNLVDADVIFTKYFNENAPFSSKGKKKSEFPDAFVIQSIKDFILKKKITIIIVSNDLDWKNSFKDSSNVIFKDTIKDALNYLNEGNRYKSAQHYFELAEYKIYELLRNEIEKASFYDANSPETRIVEIKEIDIEEIEDICLLSADVNEVVISGTAQTNIYLSANVFDEVNSFWGNEDKTYLFKEYISKDIHISTSIYFEATITLDENGMFNKGYPIEISSFNDDDDFEFDVVEDACI